MPGKALKWPEFFVRNIPNIRLESRVIPESQCFRYLHKKGILKVFTTVNQRVVGSSLPYSLVKSVSNEQFDERWVDPEFFYSKQNTNYLGGSIHPGLEWSSSSDRKNAVNFTLKIEPIGLQTPITGVRNTGVLGITPFLSNGNRFTLSSQLLLGIVRDFL